MTGYDITFCEGEDCQRRGTCHRYRQLLRYLADPDPDKKYYLSYTQPDNPETCELYWEET